MNKMKIVPLKAFKHNSISTRGSASGAAVVDPGEALPALATHLHPDRVDGIVELLRACPCTVFGLKNEPIPTLTRPFSEGDVVRIPELGVEFSVLDVPGHAQPHIAYYGLESLVCGDPLCPTECDRVLEGTSERMFASPGLPAILGDPRVYRGDAQALPRMRSGNAAEPSNAMHAARENRGHSRRENGLPTQSSQRPTKRASNPTLCDGEPAMNRSADKRRGTRIGNPVHGSSTIRR